MSNTAKFAVPGAADGGKGYVYNSGTDAHDLADVATQAELNAHDVDTTAVHGIANTAVLYAAAGTDVAVSDGGTGSSTAAGARTNLGVVIGTDVQAFDAELSALAGLVSAADSAPYFTGAGTAALTTVTAAARTVLDDVSTGAMLTTLGAQPLDTDLTALAALVSAADKVPYATGAGTWALADLTAAGRALIDDADSAAQLTTLAAAGRENGGLETLATNAASTGAVTVNLAGGNLHHLTLTGAVTLTLSGATNGRVCSLTLLLTQDATGGRAVTWPASVKWLPSGTAPAFTTTLNTRSVVQLFTIDGGTTWFAGLAGTGIA